MDLRYQFDRETFGFPVKLIPEISHIRYLRTNVSCEMARWNGGMAWLNWYGCIGMKEEAHRMVDREHPINVEGYVDQMAEMLELPLDEEFRPGVIDNFARTAAIARLVLEFPLPDDCEAAPTFQP